MTLSLLAHAALAVVRDLADGPPQKSHAEGELIRVSSPEIRRLLVRLLWERPPEPAAVLSWSHWGRAHQAPARRCHFRARGAVPPDSLPL